MSESAHTAGPRALGDLPPEAHVAALTAQGLRPGQARRAVKELCQRHLRDALPWGRALQAMSRPAQPAVDAAIGACVELELVRADRASDATHKLLWRTHDGHLIESVIIPSEAGRSAGRSTLCVSSQVGCGRRCRFCETGRLGLIRQLSTGEITAQFRQARQLWEGARGEAPPLSNVVFMGMGEPLDNLDAVIAAIEVLTHDWCWGLSARRVTVSTVGVAERIGAFFARTSANLALSLNAPDDDRRAALMPIGLRSNMQALKLALQQGLPPGRDVLVEYILFDGLNDQAADADMLRGWLADLPARLNLIPANPGPDPALRQPSSEAVWAFQRRLLDAGVRTMVRHPHGRDVGGACGQLAGAHRQMDPDQV